MGQATQAIELEMLAWRRVGYTPYNADIIATGAVAL